jgi:hypothetical protein
LLAHGRVVHACVVIKYAPCICTTLLLLLLLLLPSMLYTSTKITVTAGVADRPIDAVVETLDTQEKKQPSGQQLI